MFTSLSSDVLNNLFSGISWKWAKNINSVFIESDSRHAGLAGFKNSEEILGKHDNQIRCRAVELWEETVKQDKLVMDNNKAFQFLELRCYAYDDWKLIIVTKTPLLIKDKIIGTRGSAIDVTAVLPKLGSLLIRNSAKFKKKSLQYSYICNFDIKKLNLSKRQSECLFLLIRGKSAREIAEILYLSTRTVEDYISELKLKFNCISKSELLEKAIDLGYLYIIPRRFMSQQFSMIL